MIRPPPSSPLFPYTPLSRSRILDDAGALLGRPPLQLEPAELVHRLWRQPDVPHDRDARRDQAAYQLGHGARDRKSTRLNSSHMSISYAVFCLKKKKKKK